MSENICKGCQEELELQGTVHVDAEGYPVMDCVNKSPSMSAQEYMNAMGEVYMDEMGRLFD